VYNLLEHVVTVHGAKRKEARKYMACVKSNKHGHLKYYAVKFGSPHPGDVIQQRRDSKGKLSRLAVFNNIQQAKQKKDKGGRFGRLSVFNNLLVSIVSRPEDSPPLKRNSLVRLDSSD
jgi:hypothetical protein